ncbi:MAG TPA: endolytic transglycosylase MltG [Mycobacteriales bacterium]|nr:endolytic transglycosylase MltG [Mycobacteriales bacterium]
MNRHARALAVLVAAGLGLMLVAGVAVAAIHYVGSAVSGPPADYPGPGAGSVTVQVREGDTVARVGRRLVLAGVVRSPEAFVAAATGEERATSVQPGFYALRRRMRAADALAALLDPRSRLQGRVVVPEGYTLRQVVQAVADSTEISRASLDAAVRRPALLGLPAYARGRVEGFLFPATYDVEPDDTAVTVLRAMTARFQQAAGEVDLVNASRAGHISPLEAVIVASLVERETRIDVERPKVARVIYNRLDEKMLLQIDATIQYALGKPKARLLTKDLSIDSPYNTYRHPGLPPGPIANPGLASLRAALHPAAGDWLYYVVTDPEEGRHGFTASYDEFLRLKAEGEAARR